MFEPFPFMHINFTEEALNRWLLNYIIDFGKEIRYHKMKILLNRIIPPEEERICEKQLLLQKRTPFQLSLSLCCCFSHSGDDDDDHHGFVLVLVSVS
jgi:hypothetical protein